MRRAILTLVALSVVATLAQAQSSSGGASSAPTVSATGQASSALTDTPQEPQPVFRSGVELVRLDVRVVRSDGRPIQDLRADEVEVTEAGVRRPVLFFQHIAEPAGTYLEVARRTIGGEVSTNQGAPRGHLYVLVFDEAHISIGNEQRARTAAQRFLRARFRPGDRVALFALSGPGPQINFTRNVEQAIAALGSVRGSYDAASPIGMSPFEAYSIARGNLTTLEQVATRGAGGATDSDLKAAGTAAGVGSLPLADLERIARANASTVIGREDAAARQFLLQLNDIVQGLASIEGRKTVALFSEGFYGDNVAHEVERIAAAAARGYAVVYAFDLNRRGADIAGDQPLGGNAQADIQSRLEPLSNMATETDGTLVIDATSHIEQALQRMGEQTQDYYVVGFEPSAEALKDRTIYRRVSVRVSRPGATAHARTGYSLRSPRTNADRRASIDAALAAPFPQQGFPVELTTYVLRGEAGGAHRVILSVSAEVPVKSADPARADVVFAARSARDGRTVASGTDTMPLPAATRTGATTGIGRYNVQFNVPPGEYLMRVVVREPSGEVASVDRRFEVAAFDGVDLSASDLIVGSQTGPLPTRATVAADQGLAAALEIYARRPADLDRVDVVADLGRIGAEIPLTSVKADLLPIKTLAAGASRGAQITLPLTGVAPGQYALRAVVKAGGETVTELAREVEILPAGARVERPVVQRERPRPARILGGDVGVHYVQALASMTPDRTVATAIDAALAGDWPKTEQAVRTAPAGYATNALRGLALFAAGRWSESAAALNAALALESPAQDAKVRAMSAFLRGWVQQYAGAPGDAITAWRNATVLDPSLVPAYLALADAYLQQSQRALAIQVLRAGLAAAPQSVELQNKLKEIESGR